MTHHSLPADYSLETLNTAAVQNNADRLAHIWAQAQDSVSAPDILQRQQQIERHSLCLGFRCFAATYADEIIGFTFGMYHGEGTGLGGSEGAHDRLTKAINDGQTEFQPWLDAFEIAELQVLREHRCNFVGESLVRALCDNLPSDEKVVLILDKDKAEPAWHLYRRLGFKVMPTTSSASTEPTIMNTTLPLLPHEAPATHC